MHLADETEAKDDADGGGHDADDSKEVSKPQESGKPTCDLDESLLFLLLPLELQFRCDHPYLDDSYYLSGPGPLDGKSQRNTVNALQSNS